MPALEQNKQPKELTKQATSTWHSLHALSMVRCPDHSCTDDFACSLNRVSMLIKSLPASKASILMQTRYKPIIVCIAGLHTCQREMVQTHQSFI